MKKYGYDCSKETEFYVDKVIVDYAQKGDTMGTGDDGSQRLRLETVETGSGPFIRMYIGSDDKYEDKYWSLDFDTALEELGNVIKDFKERVNFEE